MLEIIDLSKIKEQQSLYTNNIFEQFESKFQTDLNILNSNNKYHNKFMVNSNWENISFYDCVFLISVTYNNSDSVGIHNINKNIDRLNKDLYGFYKNMTVDLLPYINRSRHNYLMPFFRAFIDCQATNKGGIYFPEQLGRNTHHHGIMLLHPATVTAFHELEKSFKIDDWANKIPNIQTADIAKLSSETDIKKSIHYSLKAVSQYRYYRNIHAEIEITFPYTKKGRMTNLLIQ